MSLNIVGKLCREFKILRQKSNLNIDYHLSGMFEAFLPFGKSLFKLRIKCGYRNGKNRF